MPWILFWTCVAQVAMATILLTAPVSFFVYVVGAQVKRTVVTPKAVMRYTQP